MSRRPPPLLALTPGTLQRAQDGSTEAVVAVFERAATAAISSGLTGILLREPSLEDGVFLELALRLRERLGEHGWLGIHDRVHLARAAGADGVHLGGTSLPPGPAREVVGDGLAIGVSTHDGDEAAVYAGADYLLHAPTFEPTSKSGNGRATLGWDGVVSFAGTTHIPVHALGGVTAQRLEAADAGSLAALAGVALIGDLWGSDARPIDGTSRALTDVGSMARSTSSLVAACARHFGGDEAAPTP